LETTETMNECGCNQYSYSKLNERECGLVFNMAKGIHNINGLQFDVTKPMTYLDMNGVYEFRLILHMHPLHHHTSPFQIIDDVGTGGFISKSGDWFDTFGVGKNIEVIMRMYTADFYGHEVVHCHILPHEDRGQMTFYEILPPGQSCDVSSGQIITVPTMETTKEPTQTPMIYEPPNYDIIPTENNVLIPTENNVLIPTEFIVSIPTEIPTEIAALIPTEFVVSIPTPLPSELFVEQNIDQVSIEGCLIKTATPTPCSCGGSCSSVEYVYTATVANKCGDQILTTGEYGLETCNPMNVVYEVGKIYRCKVLSCSNGEFDIMSNANIMFFNHWTKYELMALYITGLLYIILLISDLFD